MLVATTPSPAQPPVIIFDISEVMWEYRDCFGPESDAGIDMEYLFNDILQALKVHQYHPNVLFILAKAVIANSREYLPVEEKRIEEAILQLGEVIHKKLQSSGFYINQQHPYHLHRLFMNNSLVLAHEGYSDYVEF